VIDAGAIAIDMSTQHCDEPRHCNLAVNAKGGEPAQFDRKRIVVKQGCMTDTKSLPARSRVPV
jgi:hypothetical protein